MRKLLLVAAGIIIWASQFSTPIFSYGEEKASIGQSFIDAYTQGNRKGMEGIIEKNKDGVPNEVRDMVGYAMSDKVESKDERDFLMMITTEMATIYKAKTGDGRLLDAVQANMKSASEGAAAKKTGGEELGKIKEELTQIGKGDWDVRTIGFDEQGKLKVEINLKEKEASFNDRYVSFKDSKKAEEAVKKYLPKAKGRIDWVSGGMGMKAVILE
ncbi:MAG: hypothetical protein HZA01_08870 [Nitrospinae bacterium]|nr:hypothetical protein [Nitrospinota bacterium]